MTPRKSPRPKPSEIVPLPIHCSGTGCTEETVLLPGKIPYKQGVWLENGWQVFNPLENRSILFLCSKCRESGERSGQLSHKMVSVTLRD